MTAPEARRVPYEALVRALGASTEGEAVQTLVALLGTPEVGGPQPSWLVYDPDAARTEVWRFGDVRLGALDGAVQWISASADVVDGAPDRRGVSLRVPSTDVEVFRPTGEGWSWAPAIIRRGERFLLDLDVGQGHWDGSYRFPLTPRQAAALQADPLLYREVWEGLVKRCQSLRALDDPATLPGDAQSLIDARCGRD